MAENSPTPEAIRACLELEWTKGHGLLDAEAVVRYGAFVGSVIESHRFLPRAIDHARSLVVAAVEAESSITSGTVILADSMSRPRGRFDRIWHAPPGGVWGCMIHHNTLLPQSRRFIPFAVGLSCCQALRFYGGEQAVLRWVNDVLLNDRKVAGFLVEGYREPVHGEDYTLIGFGININNCSFPGELSAAACSLKQVVGSSIDLSEFTTFFLCRLAWNFGLLYHEEARTMQGEKFSGSEGRHMLLESWLNVSDSIGRNVLYGFDVMTEPQYRARVVGIDSDGGLLMRLDDGTLKKEYAGEIRYLDGQHP